MTTISNQSSYQPPFHYVELKTVRTFPTNVSSSSSLLSSSSFSSSDNENGPTYDVTNSGRMEKSLGNHRGRKKKCSRNTIYPLKLPDFPIKTQCPNCNKFVETHLKYQNGTCVYVCAMGLFALTFALFWVPFFVDSCKDVTHFCPDCKCTLGTKRRI